MVDCRGAEGFDVAEWTIEEVVDAGTVPKVGFVELTDADGTEESAG